MSFEPNIPNFDGFGIISNSDFPVPEAFIIKEIANQNTFNSINTNNYYNNDNKSSWYEEDGYENDNFSGYNNYEDSEYYEDDEEEEYDE